MRSFAGASRPRGESAPSACAGISCAAVRGLLASRSTASISGHSTCRSERRLRGATVPGAPGDRQPRRSSPRRAPTRLLSEQVGHFCARRPRNTTRRDPRPAGAAISSSPGRVEHAARCHPRRRRGIRYRGDGMAAIVLAVAPTRACRISRLRANGSSDSDQNSVAENASVQRGSSTAAALEQMLAAHVVVDPGRHARHIARNRDSPRSDAGCRSKGCSAAPSELAPYDFHAERRARARTARRSPARRARARRAAVRTHVGVAHLQIPRQSGSSTCAVPA